MQHLHDSNDSREALARESVAATPSRSPHRKLWRAIRLLWVTAGLLFLGWLFYSFQARGYPFEQLYQTPSIYIAEDDQAIEVFPIDESYAVGLIFYPGGMVEPRAYLPLAHAIAQEGYPVIIVKLPYRTAALAEQEAAVHAYVREIIGDNIIRHWAIGGHSRGAALATHFAHQFSSRVSALILLGTTHPKEAKWSLAHLNLPVTKVYGTRDGIADAETILTNRSFLPPQSGFIAIEGGNHSQFGYYGFQLGDEQATINRTEQQDEVATIITAILRDLRNP